MGIITSKGRSAPGAQGTRRDGEKAENTGPERCVGFRVWGRLGD